MHRRFNSKTYNLVTAPASEPVSLTEVKAFLRIDGTDDDDVLGMLIAAARRMAEEYTKRAFFTQTWRLVMDGFADFDDTVPPGYHVAPTPFLVNGSQAIRLSRQPVQSITSIKTTDIANVQTTVDAATYALDTVTGEILLNKGYSWPSSLRARAAVEITFVAGWDDTTKIPTPIKQGIIQHVAASYSNKVCADIPAGAMALYDGFRLPEAFGGF